MRKITRPGQAAIASSKKDDDADVIDVDEVDTSAFPRAAGGLRKLFQIPAANGGEPAVESGNGTEKGTENGAKNGAKNGAAKPNGNAGAAKGATAKGASAKGASSAKGAQASSSSSTSSSGSGAASGARRRNNKKRKRR